MSKKRKHDDDIRLEDVRTLDEKIKYNLMRQRKWEELEDAPPIAIIDFDLKYPIDMARPWTRPGWAADYERAQREKERILRRENKKQLNRKLYGKY